jgi:hypothetical protein
MSADFHAREEHDPLDGHTVAGLDPIQHGDPVSARRPDRDGDLLEATRSALDI